MNIKHSVNAPALSGKRSMLRRFVAVATMGALMLGVASASADGPKGKGTFSLTTHAGVGKDYTGKLDVKGDGKFTVTEEGGNLVFTSAVADGDLNMKDGRQDHTVGSSSKLGIQKGHKVTLTIDKSKLTFPEAGKSASATVPGKLKFLGKESNVTVKYSVKEDGGKYRVTDANFDFKYTDHRSLSEKDLNEIKEDAKKEAGGDAKKEAELVKAAAEKAKRVCLMLVCVKPSVNIKVGEFVVDTKK